MLNVSQPADRNTMRTINHQLRTRTKIPLSTGALIERARDYVRAHAEQRISLAQLGDIVGLSPGYLQRAFSVAFGYSPKAWQRVCREQALKADLRDGAGVAGAIYGAGFGSGSRVYESAHARLGMTPGQYARGGMGVAISYVSERTALGMLVIAATDSGICAVRLGDDADELVAELREEFPHAELSPMPRRSRPALRAWMHHVRLVIAGQPSRDVPLVPHGSDFQIRVWELLRRIPTGQTRTYTELACDLGQPTAARAVARACATNPIAVLIPCHRVIRGDGNLAGYRWGLERKRRLLSNEAKAVAKPRR